MDEAFWALGRGTGVVALVLFTLSVLLGILTRSGRPLFTVPRFSITLIHRNVSVLATVFILIHMLSLLADSYAQLTVVDLVFPFLGAYRPVWLGLGTVAVDLLIAVVATSLLRRHVGQRVFRVVHWSTYLMWPIALAHSLGTGTDAGQAWFLALAAACTVAVLAAVAWRVTAGFVEYRSVRRAEQFVNDLHILTARSGQAPASARLDPHRSPHHLSPPVGRRP
ncbi:ferric reductase-like transmembrane domain-containing protein [Cryobacterium sp. SO2]|uniref:ferric reductase-like transmembrane domain-containing protein n=1 Tax=Cryobacterium sp. SO2 TaxID=1897060 RepID=UPI00223D8FF5|nr:ferric reductase-like transmembrane domain-containing protein [Cryobacterium sp. SO2]WEO78601.1 ferric reductase-like transmembrane domain-containing protein [Cryobacterium sp. SO2]